MARCCCCTSQISMAVLRTLLLLLLLLVGGASAVERVAAFPGYTEEPCSDQLPQAICEEYSLRGCTRGKNNSEKWCRLPPFPTAATASAAAAAASRVPAAWTFSPPAPFQWASPPPSDCPMQNTSRQRAKRVVAPVSCVGSMGGCQRCSGRADAQLARPARQEQPI